MNAVVRGMADTIFRRATEEPTALAIRQAVMELVEQGVTTEAEFVGLIDLDHQSEWLFVAENVARRLEPLIRSGELHPNEIKPWQIYREFKDEFWRVRDHRAWRSALGAINSILAAVNGLFAVDTQAVLG